MSRTKKMAWTLFARHGSNSTLENKINEDAKDEGAQNKKNNWCFKECYDDFLTIGEKGQNRVSLACSNTLPSDLDKSV